MLEESHAQASLPLPVICSRQFAIRDGMILVVLAAVGVWGYRCNHATMLERGFVWGNGSTEGWVILVGPGLAALTAALGISRLLAPRPPRVELFRQPGFVAVCVALVLSSRRFLESVIINGIVDYDDWFLAMEWSDATQEVSIGIIVAWMVLALAGCLKAERGWIDRTSRAIALLWILSGILCRILPIFEWITIRNL